MRRDELPKSQPNKIEECLQYLVTGRVVYMHGAPQRLDYDLPGGRDVTHLRFNRNVDKSYPPDIQYVNCPSMYRDAMRNLPNSLIMLRCHEIYLGMKDKFGFPPLTAMVAVVHLMPYKPEKIVLTAMDCYEELLQTAPAKKLIHRMRLVEHVQYWRYLKSIYDDRLVFTDRLQELVEQGPREYLEFPKQKTIGFLKGSVRAIY